MMSFLSLDSVKAVLYTPEEEAVGSNLHMARVTQGYGLQLLGFYEKGHH